MRILTRLLPTALALVAALTVATGAWLVVAPPDLIRVGSAYAAKIVCSNVFLAGRDPDEVLAVDVQAPGHPLLKLMRVSVDREARTVRAGLFGAMGRGFAVARDNAGCTVVPDGARVPPELDAVPAAPVAATGSGFWPEGDAAFGSQDTPVALALEDPALTGPGMRAVVVVKDGRIVEERYAPGFSQATPLIGWSMTKTVDAAIIGTLLGEGRLRLHDAGLFDAWKGDGRAKITVADLMGMSSGLAFDEEYGDVTDVTRMLYLEPDMAAFAASKPRAAPPGTVFSYSTGSATMLAAIWQKAAGGGDAALAWPRRKLFDPLGMASATLELDASGTFVASSYLYATPRDWARFALMLLQDGVWNGGRVLPEGFARWMREPVPASGGDYGRGLLWLRGPKGDGDKGGDPDAGYGLPADTFWMLGHDGQSIAIIPSQRLIVLRMGLTPSKLNYKPQGLVAAIARALE